jgi:hypothetical protein
MADRQIYHRKDQIAYAESIGVTVRTINGVPFVDEAEWTRAEEAALRKQGAPKTARITDPEAVRERVVEEVRAQNAAIKKQLDEMRQQIEKLTGAK